MNRETNYRLAPPARRVLLGTAAVLSLFFGAFLAGGLASGDSALTAAGIILGTIMFPATAYLVFCAYFPRLTVTPEGLTLRGVLSFTVPTFVAWSNIERLRLTPGSEALLLSKSSEDPGARRWRSWSGAVVTGVPLYDPEQRVGIAEGRYVPLQGFAWWLEHGELLAEFRRYAPGLASGYETEKAQAEQQAAKDRRVLVIVFGVCAVVVLCAIFLALIEPQFSPATQQRLARAGNALNVIFTWVFGAALGLYAVVNLTAAWRFLRARQIGHSVFWLIAALLQILIVLAMIGALQ